MCAPKLYRKVNDVNYFELVRLSFFIAFHLLLALFFLIFFIFLLEKSLIYLILSFVLFLGCLYLCILIGFNFLIEKFQHVNVILSVIFICVPLLFVSIVVSSVSSSRLVLGFFGTVTLFLFSILVFLSKHQIENLEKLKDSYKEIASYMNSNDTALVLNRAVLHDLAIFVSVLDGTKLLLRNRKLSFKEKMDVYEKIFISVEKIKEIIQSAYSLIDGGMCYDSIFPKIEVLKIVKILESKLQYSSITVNLKDESEEIEICGDRIVFARLFLNVFLNAIEELEKSKKDVKEITILLRVFKCYLVVEVKDNGNGMRTCNFKENPSYALSSKSKCRIGSGLMFCRILIKEKFDGHIKIFSQYGKYTKVSLYYKIS